VDYEKEAAALPLASLRPTGGHLLLGEAGVGKTNALWHLYDAWVAAGLVAHEPLYVDLEAVTTEAAFERRVTRRLERRLAQTDASSKGSAALPLLCILDNVDRCGLRPKALVESLIDTLEMIDSAKVCFLLGCRTPDWPSPARGRPPSASGCKSTFRGSGSATFSP